MSRLAGLPIALALVLLSAGAAAAATISIEGGGITSLTTVTSTTISPAKGTFDDPWIISETMTGAGSLKFSNDPLVGDGSVDCGSGVTDGEDDACIGANQSKWIEKTVINNTQFAWTSFRLELPYVPHADAGVPFDDSLSFASGSSLVFTSTCVTSTCFSAYTTGTFDTWGDYLTFSGGVVNTLDSVTFKFVISTVLDNNDPFSLRQTPMAVPEPSMIAFLGMGLLLLGVGRRLSSYASHRRRIPQPAR